MPGADLGLYAQGEKRASTPVSRGWSRLDSAGPIHYCHIMTVVWRPWSGSQAHPHLEDDTTYHPLRPATFPGLRVLWAEPVLGDRTPWHLRPAINLRTHPGRPVVNLRERSAHECGTLRIRKLVGNPEGLNALLVGQQLHCPGPVGAPHASIEAERVEYLAQRLPDVRVRKRLMGQGTGPGNLDGHVVAFCQRKHVGQISKWFRRRRRLERLDQAHMINHHLGIRMAASQLTPVRAAGPNP